MPWRSRFITTRWHPLAVTLYALTFVLGFCFTFHLLHTGALIGVAPWADWLWRIELFIGGAGGLFSVLVRPRPEPEWPDLVDLLRIEGMTAGLSGLGWITYSVSIWTLTHSFSVFVLALGVIGLGLVARSGQATFDAAKAKQLGDVYDAAHRDPNLRVLLDKLQE